MTFKDLPKPIIYPLLITLFLVLTLGLFGCSGTSSPVENTTTPAVATTASALTTPSALPANRDIILASTTSTRDSGLMDVLIPIFQQKTGYIMKPVYVGTGQAMTMAEQGQADVLLVHAPASEVKFMQAGYGINRRLVMHNDFVIVGPASDPAGIKGITSATDALQKIASAKTDFYSRGDNSGTDQLEKSLWAKIGITVKDGSPDNPGWYKEANLGMGDLLRVVSEKQSYTITDRATYLNNRSTLSLDILVQGDAVLLNIYHVIQVNPDKFPGVKLNVDGAKAFSDFMVDPATQAVIGQYGVDKYGQPLFFPDAGKTEASLGSE
jgi:tungstate transport system substrate-binding protein